MIAPIIELCIVAVIMAVLMYCCQEDVLDQLNVTYNYCAYGSCQQAPNNVCVVFS